MRHFAFAGLLILAGCVDDYSSAPLSRPRQLPDPVAVCPGGDCWGMHPFEPPTQCVACAKGGLPYHHFYCTECASRLERCAHCGRRKTGRTPPPKQDPPPSPPPSPPVEKKESPPPEPKAEAPKRDEKLAVELAHLSDEHRKSHSVIVFAAENDRAKNALDTYRSHKEADIAKLPAPRVSCEPGLYLVWGHYPQPTVTEKDLKAVFNETSGIIRVTLPPFSGRRPEGGIGMDWGVDKNKSWPFVAFRVKLVTLPAGTYSFEVVEVEPDGKKSRVLSTGKFDLKKN